MITLTCLTASSLYAGGYSQYDDNPSGTGTGAMPMAPVSLSQLLPGLAIAIPSDDAMGGAAEGGVARPGAPRHDTATPPPSFDDAD